MLLEKEKKYLRKHNSLVYFDPHLNYNVIVVFLI